MKGCEYMERLTTYDIVAGVRINALKVGIESEVAFNKLGDYEDAEEKGYIRKCSQCKSYSVRSNGRCDTCGNQMSSTSMIEMVTTMGRNIHIAT